jgi:very-short-patch-repair endonuclease
MNPTLTSHSCIRCATAISPKVHSFSTGYYHLALCIPCQQFLDPMIEKATAPTIQLYGALLRRNIPAQLEKNDGFKTIDIAVPVARINIEVDGPQHNTDRHQALKDLKRTYYSFTKGFYTLRIPNTLILHHLDETAQYIAEIINEGQYNRKAS